MQPQKQNPADEIWKILKEQAKSHAQQMTEIKNSQKETDRMLKESKLETDRLLQKSKLETDRMLKESKLETDRMLKESKLETDRRIEENDRQRKKDKQAFEKHIQKIDSRWGNQWGTLIEALIKGGLVHTLKQKGIDVKRTLPNHEGCYQNVKREFDAIAIDGKELVVVETKSFLNRGDVDKFLKILLDFKNYCPEFKAWVVYGGVACLRGNKKVFSYAEDKGLFVLRVQGNKNTLLLNNKSFKPKVFG